MVARRARPAPWPSPPRAASSPAPRPWRSCRPSSRVAGRSGQARAPAPAEARTSHRQPLVPRRRSRARPLETAAMSCAAASLEIEVTPPWPYRLPRAGGRRDHALARAASSLACSASAGSRSSSTAGSGGRLRWRSGRLRPRIEREVPSRLENALERMRFMLAVDEDLALLRRVQARRVLGPAIRRRPWLRPKRRPWPWEALAWAITEQLIESSRAAGIQRRMVRRWGAVGGGKAPSAPAARRARRRA